MYTQLIIDKIINRNKLILILFEYYLTNEV